MPTPAEAPLVTYVIGCLNEEDHIGPLLDSLREQAHRPIEVLVVDGGSRDRTRDIVRDRMATRNGGGFEVRLLGEEEHGDARSPANARNIGIRAARGDLLVLLDADFFLVDRGFTATVARALADQPNVSVRVASRPQTRVEEYLAALQVPIAAVGYRRALFDRALFNPRLGYGEDEALWRALGIDIHRTCDATIGRHEPQSWGEYHAQLRWYGRTLPSFLREVAPAIPPEERRDFYRRHVWNRVPRAMFYVGAPLVALALLPFAPLAALGVALLYALLLVKNYLQLPARGKVRGAFGMMVVQLLVGSAGFVAGLAKGLTRGRRVSRD